MNNNTSDVSREMLNENLQQNYYMTTPTSNRKMNELEDFKEDNFCQYFFIVKIV